MGRFAPASACRCYPCALAMPAAFWIIAAIPLIAGIATARYAIRRLREADELQRQGFVCIGFTLIGGPVMVPRWVLEPPALASPRNST